MRLLVRFKSLSQSGRRWEAIFDCGSYEENSRAALDVAFKMHASITGSTVIEARSGR